MALPVSGADIYPHVRLVISMVVSLSVARLLTGAARFIQHPSGTQVYPVHLGWTAFMLLYLIHFWWWEYRLAAMPQWTFALFFFVVLYAILLFMLCALLYPDQIKDYKGYEDYFFSRRRWFFGILGIVFAFDIVDTALKGAARFNDLGYEYPVRVGLYLMVCVVASISENRRFHGALIAVTLIYQVVWILRQFNTFAT